MAKEVLSLRHLYLYSSNGSSTVEIIHFVREDTLIDVSVFFDLKILPIQYQIYIFGRKGTFQAIIRL